MKKIFVCLFLICILFGNIVFAKTILENQGNTIKIGAHNVDFKNEIYNIDGKIYVPIRELSDKLRIPIEWHSENNQVELMVNNKQITITEGTEFKENGVIPDEETALEVGKIILERYIGVSLEYETDSAVYYLNAVYHQLDNSWRISQECKPKKGGGGGTGVYSPVVVLNKNTGEVMFINGATQGDGLR